MDVRFLRSLSLIIRCVLARHGVHTAAVVTVTRSRVVTGVANVVEDTHMAARQLTRGASPAGSGASCGW